MKIDGLTHPKTKELAFTLGVPLPHVIGLLELMWFFVGQQTPQGNIGKWSNAVIAAEAGWQGDPDQFISALISVGFLDENEDHRLLIHDWSDHAPNWVHAKLKKKSKKIIRADLSSNLRGDLKTGQDPTSEGATSEVKCSEGKGSEVDTGGKPPATKTQSRKTAIPKNFTLSERVRKWAAEKGHDRLEARLEHFIGQAKAKGYKYVDWDSALMNAIRDDWAKLGAAKSDPSDQMPDWLAGCS